MDISNGKIMHMHLTLQRKLASSYRGSVSAHESLKRHVAGMNTFLRILVRIKQRYNRGFVSRLHVMRKYNSITGGRFLYPAIQNKLILSYP